MFDATFSKEVLELERHGVEIMVLTYVIMHIREVLPNMDEEHARAKVTDLRNHAKQYDINLGSSLADALAAYGPSQPATKCGRAS